MLVLRRSVPEAWLLLQKPVAERGLVVLPILLAGPIAVPDVIRRKGTRLGQKVLERCRCEGLVFGGIVPEYPRRAMLLRPLRDVHENVVELVDRRDALPAVLGAIRLGEDVLQAVHLLLVAKNVRLAYESLLLVEEVEAKDTVMVFSDVPVRRGQQHLAELLRQVPLRQLRGIPRLPRLAEALKLGQEAIHCDFALCRSVTLRHLGGGHEEPNPVRGSGWRRLLPMPSRLEP
mmetsp:Transcript_115104/g.360148  ORF Transcript_115104/g.360148 Transcript_115104/m.360148 type:complete len:232 (+) Transcript_115104:53-748(+)